ncbi:pyridoxal phosphate-dependent transferase [Chytridium lagenaria]|nr:pyridoxal phosphate-dependent transferase [Chytridium lagenaria]
MQLRAFLTFTPSPLSFRPQTRSHTTSHLHPKEGNILPTLPIFQIFAANTDVGKTIFSTALCKYAIRSSDKEFKSQSFYLKPVQTGFPVDSDARHVKTFSPETRAEVLFTYKDPLSPHMTAIIENRMITDDALLQAIRNHIDDTHRTTISEYLDSILFIETAGGVHSPSPSGTSQSHAYRPLRLPTILIGDSKLGGISTTLTSADSLLLQGYDIPLILLFSDPLYDNATMISRHLPTSKVITIPRPPAKPQNDPRLDATNMMVYYDDAIVRDRMEEAVMLLKEWHGRRIERLRDLSTTAQQKLWWPFTQHQTVQRTTVIDSAYGDRFSCFENTDINPSKNLFDACASWWTQTVGHANPRLVMAMAQAAGRYGHVMFPECAHEPAVSLSEALLDTVGKGWGGRVFFSDDGSTAVEVALKMAFRMTESGREVEVVGVDGGYHGDTIGAMNACSPNAFNEKVEWYRPQGLWFSPPTVACKDGKYRIRLPDGMASEDVTLEFENLDAVISPTRRDPSNDESSARLTKIYSAHISSTLDAAGKQGRTFGAVLIEPLIMGAGGMIMVDPVFQRTLIDTCRSRGMSVIFDEVFTGLYRLGNHASVGVSILNRHPDIACFAKSLTGGMVPMAVTVASEKVFEGFKGDGKLMALLHGHSYTAHPVGCAVARESLRMYEEMGESGLGRDVWDKEIVDEISRLKGVEGVVSMGTVLAVELKASQKGYASSASAFVCGKLRTGSASTNGTQHEGGVFCRPLGNVVYLMSSLTTPSHEAQSVLSALKTELSLLK